MCLQARHNLAAQHGKCEFPIGARLTALAAWLEAALACRRVTPDSQPESFYDAVGGEATFRRIAARFYELVAEDEILRPLYPEAQLGPAEERLRLVLVQQWGGPATYSRLRGSTPLAARHMPFRIARPHRDAWLRAMRIAIDEAGLAPAHAEQLWQRLETMAWNFTTHASPRTSPT
jgi:hemoglobin